MEITLINSDNYNSFVSFLGINTDDVLKRNKVALGVIDNDMAILISTKAFSINEIPSYYIKKHFFKKEKFGEAMLKKVYTYYDYYIFTMNNEIISGMLFGKISTNNELVIKYIWTDKNDKMVLPSLLYKIYRDNKMFTKINLTTYDIYSWRINQVLNGTCDNYIRYPMYLLLDSN